MGIFVKNRGVNKYDSTPVRIVYTAFGDGPDILNNAMSVPSSVQKRVTFRVKVKYPSKTFWDWYDFPPIEGGNAKEALKHLVMLAQQNVLSKARQEELAEIIALAEKATR